MNEGTRLKRECEQRLRSVLLPTEPVLAHGTAAALRAAEDESQGELLYLVVTPRRVLVADRWGLDPRRQWELAFEDISAWADGLRTHRYVVVLTHTPLARLQYARAQVPILLLRIPGTARLRAVTRTRTTLRFSRRDTAAASAIRTVLEARGTPHSPLGLPQSTRAERTRGSRVVHSIGIPDPGGRQQASLGWRPFARHGVAQPDPAELGRRPDHALPERSEVRDDP